MLHAMYEKYKYAEDEQISCLHGHQYQNEDKHIAQLSHFFADDVIAEHM